MAIARPASICLAGCVAAALCVGVAAASRPIPPKPPTAPPTVPGPQPPSSSTLLTDTFDGSDGLITNEYATWNPTDPLAVQSPVWNMTSGSLFRRAGTAWSGIPDAASPDRRSSVATGSAIFRLTTKRRDFGDVKVSLRLRNERLLTTPQTPATDWDGIHLFLRYQSEYSLYYASVNRRDGTSVIKKKCPGGTENGGTYYALSKYVAHAVVYGSWQSVSASVANRSDGAVTIALYDGARLVASAVDAGVGCSPIRAAGAVGIRGDNTEFSFDDFAVTKS